MRARPGSELLRALRRLPVYGFAQKLGVEIGKDNVFGRAAELAYFFLLSVFPLVIVITTLIGLLSERDRILSDMFSYFGVLMPPSAFDLFAQTLRQLTATSGGAKLSFGILFSLASASSGMVAVIEGLNTAYQVKEARSWLKRRLVALALTLGMSVFIVIALAILLYGNRLGMYLSDKLGVVWLFETAWTFLQWPLMVVFGMLGFCLVYRYAPNVDEQHWKWILPGAVIGFALWLAASFGLRLYQSIIDTYTRTYGSLAALIVLMLWLYLFGVAILIGGEVNALIEQSAARAGDSEAKLPGEKTPGDRPIEASSR